MKLNEKKLYEQRHIDVTYLSNAMGKLDYFRIKRVLQEIYIMCQNIFWINLATRDMLHVKNLNQNRIVSDEATMSKM